MVKIRLSRGGAKKRPFYHIVAIDSRKARDAGRPLERLGYFDPLAKKMGLKINLERVNHWQSVGAQLSERVASLIKQSKIQSAMETQETIA